MTQDMDALRQLAGEVEYSAKWYTADELTERRAMEKADAKYVAAFKPQTCLALLDRVEKAESERDMWKANHDEMVARNRVLRDRPDLPADRLPALQALVSERDALRQERNEWMQLIEGQRHRLIEVSDERFRLMDLGAKAESQLSVLTARLAEAEGLLGELQLQLLNTEDSSLFPALLTIEITAEGEGLETGKETDWIERRNAFLESANG